MAQKRAPLCATFDVRHLLSVLRGALTAGLNQDRRGRTSSGVAAAVEELSASQVVSQAAMVEAPSPKRKPTLEELKRSLVKADLAYRNVRETGGDGVEQMPIRVKSKRKAKVLHRVLSKRDALETLHGVSRGCCNAQLVVREGFMRGGTNRGRSPVCSYAYLVGRATSHCGESRKPYRRRTLKVRWKEGGTRKCSWCLVARLVAAGATLALMVESDVSYLHVVLSGNGGSQTPPARR